MRIKIKTLIIALFLVIGFISVVIISGCGNSIIHLKASSQEHESKSEKKKISTNPPSPLREIKHHHALPVRHYTESSSQK